MAAAARRGLVGGVPANEFHDEISLRVDMWADIVKGDAQATSFLLPGQPQCVSPPRRPKHGPTLSIQMVQQFQRIAAFNGWELMRPVGIKVIAPAR